MLSRATAGLCGSHRDPCAARLGARRQAGDGEARAAGARPPRARGATLMGYRPDRKTISDRRGARDPRSSRRAGHARLSASRCQTPRAASCRARWSPIATCRRLRGRRWMATRSALPTRRRRARPRHRAACRGDDLLGLDARPPRSWPARAPASPQARRFLTGPTRSSWSSTRAATAIASASSRRLRHASTSGAPAATSLPARLRLPRARC